MVRFYSQSVHHKRVKPGDEPFGCAGHEAAVSDIGQWPESETQYAESVMENGKSCDFHRADVECLTVGNGVKLKPGNAGIGMGGEAVGDTYLQVAHDIGTGIDRYVARTAGLHETVWTQVVDASHMVIVAVGEQDGVDGRTTGPEELLPNVGAAVNQQIETADLDDGRGAEARIARVCRAAYGTFAQQHRHA